MRGRKLGGLVGILTALAVSNGNARADACVVRNSPERILFIGDSHTTHLFGVALENELAKIPSTRGFPVARYGAAGSLAGNWLGPSATSMTGLSIRFHWPGEDCLARGSPLLPNQGEGIHFGGKSAEHWGRCAARAIAAGSDGTPLQ